MFQDETTKTPNPGGFNLFEKSAGQIRLFSQVGNKMKIIQKQYLEHLSEYSTSHPHDNDEKQPISWCWNQSKM